MKLLKINIHDDLINFFLSIGRIIIGLIFFYSGYSKLINPIEYFEVVINMYDIVPDKMVHFVAFVVPWIDFIFGSFLILGYWIIGSSFVLGVMTISYQLLLGQALVRHLPMDECGCFGGGYIHLTLYQSFALDTAILLIIIQIFFSRSSKFSLDNRLNKSL